MAKLLLRTLAAFVMGVAGLGLLTFLPAGTFGYWQAWAFIPIALIAASVFRVYFSIKDPALMERRRRAGPGAEQSTVQKVAVTFLLASLLVLPVLAALDHRFGWSAVPPLVSWIGDALIVLGFLMFFYVFSVNSYGSSNVQVEQDQKVVATGPYALVRHPMYVGAILQALGIPLALGSWWALLVVPVLTLPALVIRILNEERVLAADLPGYTDYTRKVRYRLVPHLW